MKALAILYIDDEAMTLKYFDRLMNSMAPVLTASSVEAGKTILKERGDEIGVLISDQKMPGVLGNEVLEYARTHFPSVIRILTTA